jgi:hypothetical protein
MAEHPLRHLLAEVATGRPPAADGGLTVLPAPPGRAAAVVLGFVAHHVVAADVDPGWPRRVLPTGSLSDRMGARFLAALADRVGVEPGGQDTLLIAPSRVDASGSPPLREMTGLDHPRLERARLYRDDVRAYAADGALLILGRGLGGRWEVAVEVDAGQRGRGLGRSIAACAPALVPGGAPLWAQVHPANVASLRAFLAAGYRPVGAEILFMPAEPA